MSDIGLSIGSSILIIVSAPALERVFTQGEARVGNGILLLRSGPREQKKHPNNLAVPEI